MLKALLWKEWQEQRWRVALATVWLLGMTAIGLKTRILADDITITVIWIPTAVILPVFLGMGLFASERRNGTLPYLLVHPVGRNQILAAKAVMGLLAYLTPMVVCGIALCLAVGGRERPLVNLVSGIAAITVFGVILFGWQLLAGLRCRQEETYVLISAIVLSGCLLYGYVLDEVLYLNPPFLLLAMDPLVVLNLAMVAWGYSPYITIWPVGFMQSIWPVAVIQSLILAGLGFGLWFRFRRLREGKS